MMVLIIWFLKVCLICLIGDFPKDSKLSRIDYSSNWISDIMKTYVPIHSSLAKKRCLQVPPLIRTESRIPIKQKHPGFPSIKSACISSLYYKVLWHFLQYHRFMHWKSHNPLWCQQCTWQYNRRESTTICDICMFILALETWLGFN
jgi:hypothetical protein